MTSVFGASRAIFFRELYAYLATPIGVLYAIIFPSITAALGFHLGDFYGREIADLVPFFQFHPWLYVLMIPALGMRLWAEEFSSGSSELLLTLPVNTGQVVLAKFFAAWMIVILGLLLTCPIWLTVNILGSPDNGAIFAAYIASGLVAGAFLAITSWASAITNNQIIAFIVASSVCLFLLLVGLMPMFDWLSWLLPEDVRVPLAEVGILTHYQLMARGVISLSSLMYFLGLIAMGLIATWTAIELRRAPK